MWPRRRLATEVLGRRPLCRALERLSVWQGTLILCYHRIGDSRSSPFHPGLFSATASSFDAQLELMARHFEVVSAHDLDRDPARPGRRILITFDDGYRDNYEHAFPCLRRHGLPATFFVSTGFLDSPRVAWWDELAWMVHNSRRPSMDADGWLREPLSLRWRRLPRRCWPSTSPTRSP